MYCKTGCAAEFLLNFAEMQSVNGKDHRKGEEPRPLQQGGNEKPPEILSPSFLDAQKPDRPNKRPDVTKPNLGYAYSLLGFIVS